MSTTARARLVADRTLGGSIARMGRTTRVSSIGGLVGALAVATGCSGRLIRLGDGTAGAEATPGASGSLGMSGVSGVGGVGGMPGSAGFAAAGGGSGGAPACQPGAVSANEVLWIGDTWITLPPGASAAVQVRELARNAGVLATDEEYVNLAAAAASMAAVTAQYSMQEAGPNKVKVLLMDGGTWDTVAVMSASPSVIAASENAFDRFLAQVAADGTVEHIVYFMVPPLAGIPGVVTLGPYYQSACEKSTVPCHYLDLGPLWEGNSDYTASGIQPSNVGAAVIAEHIWAIMQSNCIAQ
jgi:hypothetical protein